MADQKALDMLSKPPTASDLCERPEYCVNQAKIAEALFNPFDDWPKLLGRCSLCIHFRQLDFGGTGIYS